MNTSAPSPNPLPRAQEPPGGEGFGVPPTLDPSAKSPRFVLVAGEASGDLLGADLIAGLKARYPQARFAGLGGAQMIAAGLEAWYPAEKLAVMGLVEVLKHLPELLAIRRDVYRRTLGEKPAVFIGIDAPDFNLGLERKLKRAGIRTLHYVSPSVWAWREKRAEKIGRSADRVLCLFPMEPPIYTRHGVDARFVGHPLAAAFALEPDQAAARAALGIAPDALVLALLPGSRLGEIARLGRDFLDSVVLLKREFPQLQIVAPMANAACRAAFAQLLRDSGLGTQDSEHQEHRSFVSLLYPESRVPSPGSRLSLSHDVMLAADAVLLASGTAALEAMLAKRPMVVAYRVAPLTYRLVKWLGLLRTEVYSLPNILAGETLVPELMQDACTPRALADALAPMLRARALPPATLEKFTSLHRALRGNAGHDAAAAVAELVGA
ncbi:MAG: lipid-A-disaccharide synthase [Gammaproteobacteria bacterium]|nr:MAG: lipid-A-disaccharide synthase [Gammaproteobacteria bacterium]